MRKNQFIKSFALMALSLAALSCAKEQTDVQDAGVSFSVEVPTGITTRAEAGDGSSATKLYYQVFNSDGTVIEGLGVQSKDLENGKTTVNFQLVKDQTYKFIFWAQTPDAGYYTIDETEGLKKITADYSINKLSNDEKRDAFFAVKTVTVSGAQTENVELRRPFAQLNIATLGTISAGTTSRYINFNGATSAVTVKNVPTVFSPLADNDATDNKDVVFEMAAIPDGNIKVGGTDYKYLAMNYIFAPKDRTVYDLTAEITVEGKTVALTVPAAPAQRNYRTNIIGNLLTGNADFNVVIDPNFEEGSYDYDRIADGVIKTSATEEIYSITSPDGLVYAASNLFAQKKNGVYNIAADLDMSGKNYVAPTITHVAGNFTLNGNNKTISNLGNRLIAATGSAKEVKIENLTLDKANISVPNTNEKNESQGVAAFIGYAGTSETITLTNCHLTNSKIECAENKWVGGLVGYAAGYNGSDGPVFETLTIKDCSVTNNTFTGGDTSIGSVIGHGIGDAATLVLIDNVTVTSNTISGTTANKVGSVLGTVGSEVSPKAWNGKANGVHLDNYTAKDNTVNGTKVSGLDKLYGRNFCNLWVDGALLKIVASPTEFESSFEKIENGSMIALASGTYKIAKQKALNNVTFVGNGETVIDLGSSDNCPTSSNAAYNNVTFKNIKFITWNKDYKGFQHSDNLIFDGCTFTGKHFSYGTETYKNCKFIQNVVDYNIWTYSGTVSFEDCEFDCLGKSVLVYKEGGTKAISVRFNNCKFKASSSVEGKAAIEIDSSLNPYQVYINNCSADGFAKGSKSGNSLWNNKKGDSTNLKVVVDGIEQTLN